MKYLLALGLLGMANAQNAPCNANNIVNAYVSATCSDYTANYHLQHGKYVCSSNSDFGSSQNSVTSSPEELQALCLPGWKAQWAYSGAKYCYLDIMTNPEDCSNGKFCPAGYSPSNGECVADYICNSADYQGHDNDGLSTKCAYVGISGQNGVNQFYCKQNSAGGYCPPGWAIGTHPSHPGGDHYCYLARWTGITKEICHDPDGDFCPDGQSPSNGECVADGGTATTTTAAPATTTTTTAAPVACQSGQGGSPCTECEAGKYSPHGECKDCDAGKYQDQTGKSSCKDCSEAVTADKQGCIGITKEWLEAEYKKISC